MTAKAKATPSNIGLDFDHRGMDENEFQAKVQEVMTSHHVDALINVVGVPCLPIWPNCVPHAVA